MGICQRATKRIGKYSASTSKIPWCPLSIVRSPANSEDGVTSADLFKAFEDVEKYRPGTIKIFRNWWTVILPIIFRERPG